MTDQDQDIKSVRRWCGGGEVQNVDDAALRLCDEVEALRRELELARGAIAAQDEREKMAGEACGVSWIEHGCDWPEWVTETVLTLRRRVTELECCGPRPDTDSILQHHRALASERDAALARVAELEAVVEAARRLPDLDPPSRSARPWSGGFNAYVGPWIARHVNEQYPTSDYDGSETVWVGGECNEADVQSIVDRLNAAEAAEAAAKGGD